MLLLEEYVGSEGPQLVSLEVDDAFESELGTVYAIRVAYEEHPYTLIALVGIRYAENGDYAVLVWGNELKTDEVVRSYMAAVKADSLSEFYDADENELDSSFWSSLESGVNPPDTSMTAPD
ncbi:MAG TPA: hypothetical protein VLB27_07085 [candidate division Zixibacteria bacterium]|nr:hypothetical protein [candidate division Zixibacteria bacterium]